MTSAAISLPKSVPLRRCPTPRPGAGGGGKSSSSGGADAKYDPADEDDLTTHHALSSAPSPSSSLSSRLASDLKDLVTCGGSSGKALRNVADEECGETDGLWSPMKCGSGGGGRRSHRSGRSPAPRSASPALSSRLAPAMSVASSLTGAAPPGVINSEWPGGAPPQLRMADTIDTYEQADLEDEMYRLQRMTSWNTIGTVGTMRTVGTACTEGTFETATTFGTATVVGEVVDGVLDGSTSVTSALTSEGGGAGGGTKLDVAAALGLPPSPPRGASPGNAASSVQRSVGSAQSLGLGSAMSGVVLDDDGRPVPPEFLKLQQQRSMSRRETRGAETTSKAADPSSGGDPNKPHRRRRRRRRRRKKLVQFEYPPISSLRECPRIDPADRQKLFFTEDELDQIEDDRAEGRTTDDVEVVAVVDRTSASAGEVGDSNGGGEDDEDFLSDDDESDEDEDDTQDDDDSSPERDDDAARRRSPGNGGVPDAEIKRDPNTAVVLPLPLARDSVSVLSGESSAVASSCATGASSAAPPSKKSPSLGRIALDRVLSGRFSPPPFATAASPSAAAPSPSPKASPAAPTTKTASPVSKRSPKASPAATTKTTSPGVSKRSPKASGTLPPFPLAMAPASLEAPPPPPNMSPAASTAKASPPSEGSSSPKARIGKKGGEGADNNGQSTKKKKKKKRILGGVQIYLRNRSTANI